MEIFNKIKIKHIIWVIGTMIFLSIISSLFFDDVKSSYKQKIIDFRNQKNEFLKTSENSPIEHREAFDSLNYYPISSIYRVKARIKLMNDTIKIPLKKNDGRTVNYLNYAKATFKLNKKEYTVALLKKPELPDDDDMLFLPFADKTNGKETYEGGRYLDIKVSNEVKEVTLDFNLAYNPFCVYSYRYSCPLPLEENFLDLEIKAGEQLWDDKNY